MIGRLFSKPSRRAAHAQFYPLGFVLMALLVSTDGFALYKVIDPHGNVSYTDNPSLQTADKIVPLEAPTNSGSGTPLDNLPIAVREAAKRYPVILYTALECTACDKGRSMLMRRGIPFAERQIITVNDNETFQKKIGGREMPVLTIGTQVNRGYDSELWGQYLSAAGYPITSQLPRSYVNSLPQPLTTDDPAKPSLQKLKPISKPLPPPPPPPSPTSVFQF